MNLLQVCADRGIPANGTKGASVHLRSMAAALAARGHSVTTFLARPGAPFPADIRPLGSVDDLASAARGLVPHVIFERYSLGHDGGLVVARQLGCPFVLEVNAPLVDEASRHRPGSVGRHDAAVEARLLSEADIVVAVSEPLRRWVASVRSGDHGTAVLHNGCDPAVYPRPAPIDDGGSPPTIAFLGHPKPWHGADRLPMLLAKIHRVATTLAPPRLLVIGGGPGVEPLLSTARELGIGGWIDVTGALPRAEAAARLSAAWVAVAPYPPDPAFYFCPLKVLEYLAAGLPVVASAQGDVPALVGDAGILVDPGDDEAFVEAVTTLLTEPSRARDLGRRGRQRVLSEMTWDHVAARWEDLVIPLVAGVAA